MKESFGALPKTAGISYLEDKSTLFIISDVGVVVLEFPQSEKKNNNKGEMNDNENMMEDMEINHDSTANQDSNTAEL